MIFSHLGTHLPLTLQTTLTAMTPNIHITKPAQGYGLIGLE